MTQSLLDKVAARRRERLKHHHLDLPIQQGGWDGDLVARYVVRDKAEWQHIDLDVDVLAKCCAGLFLRNDDIDPADAPDNGAPAGYDPLVDDKGDPIGFDARLTAKLGDPDVTEARDVVRYVFREDDGTVNDLAIGDMAVVVRRWTSGRTVQAEAALLGGA